MTDESQTIEADLRAAENAMLSREQVERMLLGLAEHGGPSGVTLDEAGTAILFDDAGRPLTVIFQQGFPGIALTAPVLPANELPRRLLIRLLAANASPELTGGGVFAVLAPGEPLSFCRRLALPDADPASCVRAMQAFLAVVAEWERHLDLIGDLDAEEPLPKDTAARLTAMSV